MDNREKLEKRINSVSRPSAQNNTLCDSQPFGFAEFVGTLTIPELRKKTDLVDYSVILLLHYFGLRISEVLNIRKDDILEGCLIRIRSLKGGANRLVSGQCSVEYWSKVGLYGVSDHTQRGRFYYYRLFKRLNIYSHFVGNQRNSVTHSLRHEFVLRLLRNGLEYEEIKTIIGHSNIKNTKIYGKSKSKGL